MTRLTATFIRYPRISAFAGLCVVLAILFSQGLVVTVVPTGGASSAASFPASGLAFNPKAYVARVWPSQVVPAARDQSVSLTTFLAALSANKSAALQKFGRRVNGSYNVLVHFSGTVSKLDTASPIGTVVVNVRNGSATLPVAVATGPVILGTTLRDAMKFISFGEFLNQIQYGDVADELNSYVVDKVIAPVHLSRLVGRHVRVFGAYAYDEGNPRNITVTPVLFQVGGEPAHG